MVEPDLENLTKERRGYLLKMINGRLPQLEPGLAMDIYNLTENDSSFLMKYARRIGVVTEGPHKDEENLGKYLIIIRPKPNKKLDAGDRNA